MALVAVSSAAVLQMVLLVAAVQAETVLLDPQFNVIAPCPCDLTGGSCDIGCCCDTVDCSSSDLQLFDCIGGFFGGNRTVINRRSCSVRDSQQADYHPFTCVLIENYNAYLGLYFPNQAKLANQGAVNTRATESTKYQFPAVSSFLLLEASTATSQRKGLILLERPTAASQLPAAIQQLANSRLALPRATGAGACDRTAGVVFLDDDSLNYCDIVASSALCSSQSPLSYSTYALPCNATGCTKPITTRNTGVQVPVTVNYLTVDAAGYQKDLPASTAAAGVAAAAAAPAANATHCNNAVVDVSYTVSWNGTEVSRIVATVLMSSLTLESTVTQRFAVNFVHAGAGASSTKRSGLVGYQPGADLLFGTSSGTQVNNSQVNLLIPSAASGACTSSGSAGSVKFLENSANYCQRQVSLAEFNNCSQLGDSIQQLLRAQLPPDVAVVGVHGSANSTVAGDWAAVVEEPAGNATIVPADVAWTNLSGICLDVTVGLQLTILYAEQGKANDSSIWQVVAVLLQYETAHLSANCRLGDCSVTDVTLATKVLFVRVPRDWAENPAAALGPYQTACWWDICWWDIFYPMTQEFPTESRARTLALTLFFALIIIFFCCLSKPWW